MKKSKINWKTLIISVALPLIVGLVSRLLTAEATEEFSLLEKPPLSPPAALFGIVWTVLYILMGVSCYLVITKAAGQERTTAALKTYIIQLVINFFWSIIFFNFGAYFLAFLWLLLLLYFVVKCAVQFFGISKVAGLLFIPYIIWIIFAGYLNLAIAFLN